MQCLDIVAMWQEYGKDRSEALRNQLMEYYLPLVRRIARRIHAKLPREVEFDDLASVGAFGLMEAIESFDPSRGVRFETYCINRIRGAILDELRSWDWVPRLARVRSNRLAEATQELQLELGREPSVEELCQRLGVSADELEKIVRDACLTRVLPLSRPRVSGGADEFDSEAIEDSRAADRARSMERADLLNVITKGLSRAEQLVLVLYHFEQMTMKEIGLTLDLSESRVSQMHSAVLSRLQHELSSRRRELITMAA